MKISARRYMNTTHTEWVRVINGKHFGFVATTTGVEVWEYRGVNRGSWKYIRKIPAPASAR